MSYLTNTGNDYPARKLIFFIHIFLFNTGPCDVNCRVINGTTWSLMKAGVNFDDVRNSALPAVKAYIDNTAASEIQGLESALYLGPRTTAINAVMSDSDPDQNQPVVAGASAEVSTRSIAIFACGAVAFVAAVGIFAFLKQSGNEYNDDSAFTKDHEPADIEMVPTAEVESDNEEEEDEGGIDPRSPFSKMLPASYQLGESLNMSVIIENDNESQGSSNVNTSIMLSEGSITDVDTSHMDTSLDTETDVSNSSNLLGDTPILGARRRNVSCCFRTSYVSHVSFAFNKILTIFPCSNLQGEEEDLLFDEQEESDFSLCELEESTPVKQLLML